MSIYRWCVRNKLLLFIITLLTLPVLLSGYMLYNVNYAEQFLVQHQRDKLNVLVDRLDTTLSSKITTMSTESTDLNKDQIRLILKNFIATNTSEFPELEVGFYSYNLHTIVVNGTGGFYLGRRFVTLGEQTNGQISKDAEKQFMDMTERRTGTIIEISKPVVRDGKFEGVIWGIENLNLTGIQEQIDREKQIAYLVIGIALLLGLGGSVLLIRNFIAGVHDIKAGLHALESDLNNNLQKKSGEFGEIIAAINHLASKLRKTQSLNEIIITSISDAVVAIDNKGLVIMANPASHQMLGLHTCCLDCPVDQGFPSGSPFPGILWNTLKEGPLIKEKKYSLVNADQETRELLVNTSHLINGRSGVIGTMLHCIDITESTRLQQKNQLQERLAALGKLVAGVAHEIRNPLTSISGYVEYLEKAKNPSARSWGNIKREINRLNMLLERLLLFARPADTRFAPGDINSLLEVSLQILIELNQDNVGIVREFTPHLPLASMDSEQMEQVIKNIIYNAYQAMPNGGQLTIRTGICDGLLYMEFTDTGVGIAADEIPLLFDPFFTTRAKGSGLGLTIAYEIVKAHEGSIEVNSEPGKGTTFTVFLHRYSPEENG
ncbi:signal transduction histidine kinase, nitrogen specific [Desulfosporosinus orientis DSM 765]|uniref:histidine kinase n=1 Tax=Desulfosporosinus orientis (strain ATCC 19365 / DSM 765 / NCIMB 8382 / VKM B-1628 / Singapore I) TaxID=768706 RepID=G7W9D1_DESOD|nr:ATP-binding protein [Desulfosporosinus orientis]AET69268.1 signal transduction histidine kinase, nitrogen specific [Desulfosporosinus orientis DSM 765]